MKRKTRILFSLAALLTLATPHGLSQQPTWQTAAGGNAAFETASLRPANPETPYQSNVDLVASDYFRYHGGLITADGLLINYIIFAFKIFDTTQYPTLNATLPKWAQTEEFVLQARATGNPGKDQIRLMVQTLLAERFNLALHVETRQLPIYALTLDTPGKPGPGLKPHPADVSCTPPISSELSPQPPKPAAYCAPLFLRENGGLHMKIANWSMEEIAGDLATTGVNMGRLDPRPILDRTGLQGLYDIDLRFIRQSRNPDPAADDLLPAGATFTEALRTQAGLKLTKETGPVQVVVVDHVDKPSGN